MITLAKKSIIVLLISLILPLSASAAIFKSDKQEQMQNNIDEFAQDGGYSTEDTFDNTISTMIQIVLASVGTVFIILMFIAGFNWMRAAGNEERVKKSKRQIQSLIIGLIIVLAAYAISYWVSDIIARQLAN